MGIRVDRSDANLVSENLKQNLNPHSLITIHDTPHSLLSNATTLVAPPPNRIPSPLHLHPFRHRRSHLLSCLLKRRVFLKLSVAGTFKPRKDMANQPNNENHQAPSSTPLVQNSGDDQGISGPSAGGFFDSLENQYKKIKEHAETYPYVWGSYIVVYGGFGLWMTYRWRKLRKTEDRVRTLQERLRKLVEADESGNSAKVVEKGSTSSEKPSM